MLSLLNEDLINIDNKKEICKQEKYKYFDEYTKNIIKNKLCINSDLFYECSLNIHSFNPSKNSLSNEWQFRLIKRINSLNSLENNN